MDQLLIVILLSTLGELIIEALKPAIEPIFSRLPIPDDINPYLYLALTLGLVLAAVYRADLLAAVGLSAGITTIGVITTGLFIGRGANFVSDVISRLGN